MFDTDLTIIDEKKKDPMAQFMESLGFKRQEPVATQPVTQQTVEPYLQMFAPYMQKPQDTQAQQKRLQTAAVINALGNVLTNVVNSRHLDSGTPIIKTDNRYVLSSLQQNAQLQQEDRARKDMYDRMNLQNMMNATNMAREDMRYADTQNRYDRAENRRAYEFDETMKAANAREANDEAYRNWSKEFQQNNETWERNYKTEQAATQKSQFNTSLQEREKDRTAETQKFIDQLNLKNAFPIYDKNTNSDVMLSAGQFKYVLAQEVDALTKAWGVFQPDDYAAKQNAAENIVMLKWKDYFDLVDVNGVPTFVQKSTSSEPKNGVFYGIENTVPASNVPPNALYQKKSK